MTSDLSSIVAGAISALKEASARIAIREPPQVKSLLNRIDEVIALLEEGLPTQAGSAAGAPTPPPAPIPTHVTIENIEVNLSATHADKNRLAQLQRLGGHVPPDTSWSSVVMTGKLKKCREIASEISSQLRSAKRELDADAYDLLMKQSTGRTEQLRTAEEAFDRRDADALDAAAKALTSLQADATEAWRVALKKQRGL